MLTWIPFLDNEKRMVVAAEGGQGLVHQRRRHVHVHHGARARDEVNHVRVRLPQGHPPSREQQQQQHTRNTFFSV